MTPPARSSARAPLLRAALAAFLALSGAYGLSVAGFLALRLIIGEQWTLVALFNSFAHLLFLPSLALIPIVLILRRMLFVLLLIPAALAFLLSYGPMFVPRSAVVFADAPRFTLLTYNLKALALDIHVARPLETIRAINADVVALQELSEEMAAYLDRELAEEYPYRAFHPQPGEWIPGQGVLSRFPLTSSEYWRIYLGHQKVTIDFADSTITLFNTHPLQPFAQFPGGFTMRAEEITELLRRAEQVLGPVIMAGDFNMSDQSEDYGRVAARYHDAYRNIGRGMGFTFPDFSTSLPRLKGFPLLARIDYVFHDESFAAIDARVWPDSGGSDHRPLVTVLALLPNR